MSNLTEENILFLEDFYTPKRLLEVLFHDFRNLNRYKKNKYGSLRFYQEPMVSDESIIDFELTAKHNNFTVSEIFEMRQRVSNLWCMGARGFGKTLVAQQLDLINNILTDDQGTQALFATCDVIHIQRALMPIKESFENHELLKYFKSSLKCSPDYQFLFKSGYTVNSVNFNLNSRSPGDQFIGAHTRRLMIDETSRETDEVYDKRKDAIDPDFGAVMRFTGMCDFVPNSPAGKAFYNLENKANILNYPQYVSPFWSDKKKEEKILEYGGEDSQLYKIYVKGEIVEDGVTALDMKRIRDNSYMLDARGKFKKKIKRFEIDKKSYPYFKNTVVLERPNNSDNIYVALDVGAKVTEVIIISDVAQKYEYIYNITLYNLTQQELDNVLEWIIKKVQANIIAIDCGDGEGRGIYSGLELKIAKDKLVYYDGSMKIKVGYEYEDETEDGEKIIKTEKGVPIYKYEYMSEFSVRRLKHLLYGGVVKVPEDYKLDEQLYKVIQTSSGSRLVYKCLNSSGDHLFDAFKVFFIAEWLKCGFIDIYDNLEDNDDWGTGASN